MVVKAKKSKSEENFAQNQNQVSTRSVYRNALECFV